MNEMINRSCDYIEQVAKWKTKFEELMLRYSNAAKAILAYYLPNGYWFVCCPLGVEQFRMIGEAMRTNEAMLTAAEDVGLIAEAVNELFWLALDNHGNWCGMVDDVRYMLNNPFLSPYIRFEYRYSAEKLLASNLVDFEDEDLWLAYSEALDDRLGKRNLAGY